MNLKELLEGMQSQLDAHDKINNVTISTFQNYVNKAAENKNTYIHASIIYDVPKIPVGEWTVKLPVSIIYSDKLQADSKNELFVHSNTLSACTETVKNIRAYFFANGCEGFLPGETNAEVWTEKFGDAWLAGTKLDGYVTATLTGFCEPNT